MGIRRATILFADIIGCSEVSNNIAITDYDKFIVHFHDIAMKAQELLFPKSRYTLEEFEFSVKGDEVCLILHSGQAIDLNKSNQEEGNKLAYQNDVRNAILFAFSLKLLWLVGKHNMERIKSALLPRDIAIGINYGPLVFATHPATARQKSSEGFSINLAKRIEGASREGKCSKVFVSKEIKYLAEQANVPVAFDEGVVYPLKGITTAPYLHEIIEIDDSTLITASPVMEELSKIPKEGLERYYQTAIVNDQEFWLTKLVGYLLLAAKDDRALSLLQSEDVVTNYFEQANAQYYLGHFQEAANLYHEVIRLTEGQAPEALNNKGAALAALGRLEKNPELFHKAIDCYDKALELRKDNPDAWNNEGNALADLGRLEKKPELFHKAIECHNKALELRKDLPEAWYNKACAFALLKEKDKMLEALNEAIKLDAEYKNKAKKDEDFKAYWEDEDFKAIVK